MTEVQEVTGLTGYLEHVANWTNLTMPLPEGQLRIEQFVLKYGQAFTSQPLENQEVTLLKRAMAMFVRNSRGHRLPQIKQCFYNSQLLAACDDTGQIKYVEGFLGCIIPIPHAWNSINNKLIDVTLRPYPDDPPVEQRDPRFPKKWPLWNLGVIPDQYEYFGVVFPDTLELITRPFVGLAIIDDWQNGWPLLRGELAYGLEAR